MLTTIREYNEKMNAANDAALAMPTDTEFQRMLRAQALENLVDADMVVFPVLVEEECMTLAEMALLPAIVEAANDGM